MPRTANGTRLWLTWERQRRNRELSQALGAELIELSCDRRLLRYPLLAWKTLAVVLRSRSEVIFGQNPSLVLAALLVQLRRLRLINRLVIDAHNAGLFPREGRSPCLNRVARWVQRGADLTLVSNEGLERLVRGNGGRAFSLPDPIPLFRDSSKVRLRGRTNVLFVCTFAPDEPYREVFEAAALLDSKTVIYASGDWRRSRLKPSFLPSNVILTGYLPETDYLNLLRSVDAVVDLTTREDCLVCGAYEAVAAGKPLVLSDTAANRAHFTPGALLTRNSATAIAAAIHMAVTEKDRLMDQVAELRQRLERDWTQRQAMLEQILGQTTTSPCSVGASTAL